MGGLSSRIVVGLIALAVVVGPAAGAVCACPFCTGQGETLTNEAARAKLVLYGDLANAQEDATTGEGTTDIVIEAAIKVSKDCESQKTIKLARYIPAVNKKYRYLVYCDVVAGKVDPYRVFVADADGSMPKYLKGALALKDDKIGKRLRFFFDYLDNADPEISNDAYKEFANADYKDYRDMAKSLPADRIAKWLTDSKTPAFRIGLYASMLGHCGTKEHATLLRKLLDDPIRRVGMGVDGILAGYTMADPKAGWAYIREIFADGTKEFLLRYAALRATRFLHDYLPDLVAAKELGGGIALMLEQKDIADLAIDELRKWKCWDMTDRILALKDKAPYEVPIVRRSILRFCLAADNAAARAYVADQRQKDAQMVADVEELLKLEQTPPPATAGK